MKKLLLICSMFLLGNLTINAQLAAGDIAFIGFNEDVDDGFSFITLADIPGSEVIFFAEEGWDDDVSAWVNNTEVHLQWVAPGAGTPCGTIISIIETGIDVFTVTGGGTVSIASGSGWSFSGGDQALAYQGANVKPAVPTFIAGILTDDGGAGPGINPITKWNDNSPYGGQSSGLPLGLTNGVNCVSLFPVILTEVDNSRYNGTLTGTSTALRALINDRTNWISDNGTAYNITPSGYASPSVTCVAACTNPTVPTITATPNPICVGSSATLNITGTLNDATQWAIYTGSCGGILLGTTTTSSFVVTPGTTTTYYVRGEGGCVTPGSCGDRTVNVTALDNASFSYGASSYCFNGTDPTPTITGLAGGTFTSSAGGLSINASTGTIDLSASTPATYTVTYTTVGSCPNSSNVSVTVSSLNSSVTQTAGVLTANQAGASYQWYQCPSTLLTGETNQSFTPTVVGNYKVVITLSVCTVESACENVTVLGAESFENKSTFKIYPNPTEGLFKMNSAFNGDFIIVNQLGQTVKTFKVNSNVENIINVENLSDGIYFIKETNGTQISGQKLIIKK